MKRILASSRDRVRRHNRNVEIGLSDSTEIHFLTFANTSYMAPTRIVSKAEPFIFDSVRALTEKDIPEFIEKHQTFIDEHKHGFGCWIWKPKIIHDRLLAIKENDFLVYCDAGMHLNQGGMRRYYDYLKTVNMPETHLLTFSANETYQAHHWVKADAVDAYFPDFWNKRYRYCYAGVMILKNTKVTRQIIKEWLELCETYEFLDPDEFVKPNHPEFRGNDYDNGLFNLCLAKHNITTHVFPDETNLYDSWGFQNHMYTNDWSSLDRFPFQCRRLRPR